MMRLYHYTIVFVIFAMGVLSICEMWLKQGINVNENAAFYHEALERATEAGADALKNAGDDIGAAADRACDAFMSVLAAYIGIMGMTPDVAELSKYIPIILITDESGFYISVPGKEICPDTSGGCGRIWSPHIPYSCELEDCVCIFSEKKTVYLFDRYRHYSGEGDTALIGLTEIEAEERTGNGKLRQETISKELVKYLEHYCTKYNRIANDNGLFYRFFIPEAASEILQSVEGTGFFALFQGYPPAGITEENRNLYSFAGCEVEAAESFFVNVSGEGYASDIYYHSKNCRYKSDETRIFYSRRECAQNGAFECPECGGGAY